MGLPVEIRGLQTPDWEWISCRAGCVLCEDTDGLVALRGGDLVAAAVFDQFSDTSCSGHIVLEDPFVIRADFLTYVFSFPFLVRGLDLVVGYTPSDNAEALKFNRHMGFRETYRIPGAYKKGVDLVIQEMRKDECRWITRKLKRAA